MHRFPFDPTDLRRRAEQTLLDRDPTSELESDPMRVLHELRVHQIELEIQNEELVSANRDLDALRSKFQALYESAPVGYLTLSTSGHVVDCNAKALEMLGLDHASVLKRRLRDSFESASLRLFDALLLQASEEGSATANEELMLRRPKRIPMYVRAQSRTLRLPHHDANLYLFVMMDVSALKFALDDMATVIQKASELPPARPTGD